MDNKLATEHSEHKEETIVTPPSEQEQVQYDSHVEKKLIRRVDWRLLPILGALYSIALIDRVNVSIAIHTMRECSKKLICTSRFRQHVFLAWTLLLDSQLEIATPSRSCSFCEFENSCLMKCTRLTTFAKPAIHLL